MKMIKVNTMLTWEDAILIEDHRRAINTPDMMTFKPNSLNYNFSSDSKSKKHKLTDFQKH